MAKRLLETAASTDPMDNLYRNSEQVRLLKARLDAAPGGQAAGQLKVRYAEQLLLAGRTEDAIAAFEEMAERFSSMGQQVPRALTSELDRMLIMAYLRLAEEQNCLDHHNAESCLLPLAGGGVHAEPKGGRAAYQKLTARLSQDADDWEARWLINLAAMTLGSWPDGVPEAWRLPSEAFASDHDPGRFPDVAAAAGVAVHGQAGGVVMEDLDGDGLLDLLVSSWGLTDPLHLLRNRGDGRFEDISKEAGLEGLTGGLNLLHADYDNDGDNDVLVLRGAWFEKDGQHPNSLLRNTGDGHFEDVTEAAGLLSFHPTQTAAWGDYDNDGWLDLFIGNETGPVQTHRSELYRNLGDGRFEEVSAACGLDIEVYAKGTAWGDLDDDGDIDLFISRIDGPNLLYRNDGATGPGGNWRFREIGEQAGVTKPFRSFPTWLFDYDNDGRLDLFVSGYRYKSAGFVAQGYLSRAQERAPGSVAPDAAPPSGKGGKRKKDVKGVKAKLFRNLGGMRFEDVSAQAKLDEILLTMGSNFGDIDNDGWLDLYCATGEPDYAALYPNRMFRNAGGQQFQDVTTAGGFGHAQKGHGVAFGDLDNDGDQDIYAVMGGAYEGDAYPNALFLNPGHGQHWLNLKLQGVRSNRSAVGARIEVRVRGPSGPRSLFVQVGTGGSFGSSSLAQEIGLGDAKEVLEVLVRWPSSLAVQRFGQIPMDAALLLVEGETEAIHRERPQVPLGP